MMNQSKFVQAGTPSASVASAFFRPSAQVLKKACEKNN
jgi:hypothetical protein